MASTDPFDPPGVTWQRVSPRLTTVRLGLDSIGVLITAAVLVVLSVIFGFWWLWLTTAVIVGLCLAWMAFIPRRVRSWGYAERDDDLLIRHGLLFRTLVVVPYGRMQYVDVTAGPIDRAAGLASVQLHTASAGTDAHIPGLPAQEAARLRDRLAARGESRLAGL